MDQDQEKAAISAEMAMLREKMDQQFKYFENILLRDVMRNFHVDLLKGQVAEKQVINGQLQERVDKTKALLDKLLEEKKKVDIVKYQVEAQRDANSKDRHKFAAEGRKWKNDLNAALKAIEQCKEDTEKSLEDIRREHRALYKTEHERLQLEIVQIQKKTGQLELDRKRKEYKAKEDIRKIKIMFNDKVKGEQKAFERKRQSIQNKVQKEEDSIQRELDALQYQGRSRAEKVKHELEEVRRQIAKCQAELGKHKGSGDGYQRTKTIIKTPYNATSVRSKSGSRAPHSPPPGNRKDHKKESHGKSKRKKLGPNNYDGYLSFLKLN